ncbi:hypothetical protein C8R43DRAFT_1167790 [Mycena crocata]|nr:hypothetical protein C8R43DRAFT_1167790 [Mycena crocata]
MAIQFAPRQVGLDSDLNLNFASAAAISPILPSSHAHSCTSTTTTAFHHRPYARPMLAIAYGLTLSHYRRLFCDSFAPNQRPSSSQYQLKFGPFAPCIVSGTVKTLKWGLNRLDLIFKMLRISEPQPSTSFTNTLPHRKTSTSSFYRLVPIDLRFETNEYLQSWFHLTQWIEVCAASFTGNEELTQVEPHDEPSWNAAPALIDFNSIDVNIPQGDVLWLLAIQVICVHTRSVQNTTDANTEKACARSFEELTPHFKYLQSIHIKLLEALIRRRFVQHMIKPTLIEQINQDSNVSTRPSSSLFLKPVLLHTRNTLSSNFD